MNRSEELVEEKRRLSWKLARGTLTVLIGMVLIIGCMTTRGRCNQGDVPERPSETQALNNRIIIKFQHSIVDPPGTDFVNQLSRDAGAPLIYLHTLAGQAYVFVLENVSDAIRIKEIIQSLKKRSDVAYVEQDTMMHHQEKQR
jgi:hypothetical protein